MAADRGRDLRRALSVQAELTAHGQLGAVSLADLIIAAVAERHCVCVLHYDADYERVATITGQLTRWVVPEGSLHDEQARSTDRRDLTGG